jgi:hypothetical protein
MKRITLAIAALTVAAGFAVPAVAAPVVVVHPPVHHHAPVVHKPRVVNVCTTKMRNHHPVRVCHRVRR